MRGTIPTYVAVTSGKVHDVRMLDALPVTEGAIYTMGKAYTDFARLHALNRQGAFLIPRAKDNLRYKRSLLTAIEPNLLNSGFDLYLKRSRGPDFSTSASLNEGI